jgi:uncharacterized membrane-anchored protein
MKLPSRQKSESAQPGITGTARADRRTPSLLRRLRPGDIAVVDHLDLDRSTAEALVSCGVSAVVNAAPFISGRYPNLGPERLVQAGVVMVDDVGAAIFGRVRDGAAVRIHDGKVLLDGTVVAEGQVLGPDEVAARMEDARTGLSSQLESFTHNTTEFLRREQDLLLHGQGAPAIRTRLSGRPAVIVVKGYDYRADLARLKRYIREQHPVLIAVDAGADALLAAGHRPDIVVVGADGLGQATLAGEQGDIVSDKALRSAREVVLHSDRAGRTVGADRLDRLGVRAPVFRASGATQDVAMLLADLSGASLLVSVGSHATLDEFLDRQRSAMASTFLTRLRIGPKLVDSQGVAQLYAGRVRVWHLLAVLLAGLIALCVALATTSVGQEWWDSAQTPLRDLFENIRGLLS